MPAEQQEQPKETPFTGQIKGIISTGVKQAVGKTAIAKKIFTKAATATATIALPAVGQIVGSLSANLISNLITNKKMLKNFLENIGKVVSMITSMIILALIAGSTALGTTIGSLAIIVPVVVVLFMYIINSGAFMVPPNTTNLYTPTSYGGQAEYLLVTKEVIPSGPFQNSNLPLEVTYKVTIHAKRDFLTNISVTNSYSVFQAPKRADPPTVNMPDPPARIEPGNPYIFEYTTRFEPQFEDSLVTDTIIVTAMGAGTKEETVSASAFVIIGKPPTACFVFEGNWSSRDLVLETTAIAQLSQASIYITSLCSRGDIHLIYNADQSFCPKCGGYVPSYKTIYIFPKGLLNIGNALYTLAHESGHIYGQVVSGSESQYIHNSVSGTPICTYPLPQYHTKYEDFAEMIALYIVQSPRTTTRDFSCLGGRTFQQVYPDHWIYARNHIFFDALGWPDIQ